jgi:hypothetical protein
MTDIKDFILQLEDTTLSLEEQQAALLMIEQTLIENKQIQEKTLEESSNLIVDAVRTVEEKLDAKFTALKTDSKLKGPKGDQGIRGENGKSGRDGVNGKDGINGHDGADGIDGKDGRYVVNVEVDLDDTLLVTLSDGTQIKTTKEIKGPKGDQGPQGLRGSPGIGLVSGGSSGQVLTKASDSDYDTTWTTNGAGTVTSVGGTGTVNGLSLSGTVTSTGNLTLGGTLDLSAPPAIGATTPAAGTFTTITGQTEVLKGTGQNLVTYSSTLTSVWGNNNTTFTSGQTDPFSGTGAILLNNGTASNLHYFNQAQTLTAQTYTLSVYVKAGTANYAGVGFYTNNFFGAGFNLTTGVFSSNVVSAVTSYTSTNAGSGWWRISATITAIAGTNYPSIFISEDGTNWNYTGTSKTIYVAAPQLELGSVVNTYIPTTTTAIYGTPTLSFSGVSEIGLLSNGALYLQPAGTGALQAQATTSTTAGGNARGANAVDWQTARTNANQVASATYTFIGGGISNTSSSFTSALAGGNSNVSSNQGTFVGGGQGNTASGVFSSTVGGRTNTAAGYLNFIGGGFTNSGTANAAVTTQSATMNATTAVTLSGSNASIKVGQYITGTSIATDTYVAAISGTALTLSVAASGSSTSTLSFYTPHGVVVGGGNNQATGSYSFIGGGGDAGTAGQRNTSSGDWSVVCGGAKNIASGAGSFIGGGGLNSGGLPTWGNTASGLNSSSVGGQGSAASGNYSFVGGGLINAANSSYSAILGGTYGTTRGIVGNQVFPACNSPIAGTTGISQAALLILAKQTTDATATVLTSDGSAAGGSNQVIMPNNSAYFFTGEVISGKTAGGDTKGWTIEGVIKRGANAASTALVGTPTVTSMYADVGAATWTIAVTADTTNGGLRVTFTGQAATTIRTVCQIRTTEMTY